MSTSGQQTRLLHKLFCKAKTPIGPKNRDGRYVPMLLILGSNVLFPTTHSSKASHRQKGIQTFWQECSLQCDLCGPQLHKREKAKSICDRDLTRTSSAQINILMSTRSHSISWCNSRASSAGCRLACPEDRRLGLAAHSLGPRHRELGKLIG